jgi:hypothetical protein
MTVSPDTELCIFCKTGRIINGDQNIAFKQRTERGYIFCDVNILVDVCDHCGATSWDQDAEAIIENAVRREYKRLLYSREAKLAEFRPRISTTVSTESSQAMPRNKPTLADTQDTHDLTATSGEDPQPLPGHLQNFKLLTTQNPSRRKITSQY